MREALNAQFVRLDLRAKTPAEIDQYAVTQLAQRPTWEPFWRL
jgi:hypothetical protein